MNAERFAAIVEAYGADPRRWPASERAAAQVMSGTAQGRRILADAEALDALLDGHRTPAPSADLRWRVLEARPTGRRGLPYLGSRARAWGAGLAAAGLAGVVFGAALSHRSNTLDARTETLLAETEAYDVAALTGDAEAEAL